jgi:diguanylate cyclase
LKLSELWQFTQLDLTRHRSLEAKSDHDWNHEFVEFGQALLTLLQQYRWEIEEIKSQQFIQKVEEWKAGLGTVNQPQALADYRLSVYEKSSEYLKKEKNYLVEREAELKNMVTLLSEAVSTVVSDNGAYHQEVLQCAQGLSQISQLEDIKKIRLLLAKEIEQLKEVVKQKLSHDRQHQEQLSQYVEALQSKLQSAVNRSLKDPLTGLYNRQGWDQELVNACHTASVTKVPFALALLDIDNFKQVNDKYGHQVGDLILIKVAKEFRESFRSDDYLARYGGDEFAFILETPSLEKAQKRLERLCKDLSKPTYQCVIDKTEFYLRISLSCGVGIYRESDTPETLLRRSDQALYLAKQTGKNRVVPETPVVAKSA